MKRLFLGIFGKVLLLGFVAPLAVLQMHLEDEGRIQESVQKLREEAMGLADELESVALSPDQKKELARVIMRVQTDSIANRHFFLLAGIAVAGVILGLIGVACLQWTAILDLRSEIRKLEGSQPEPGAHRLGAESTG